MIYLLECVVIVCYRLREMDGDLVRDEALQTATLSMILCVNLEELVVGRYSGLGSVTRIDELLTGPMMISGPLGGYSIKRLESCVHITCSVHSKSSRALGKLTRLIWCPPRGTQRIEDH